jgi:phosphatidylinositol-3-phosphatase
MGMRFRKTALALAALALAAAVSASLAQGAKRTGQASQRTRVSAAIGVGEIEHIFVIVLENHSLGGVIGDTADAPFINGLANDYAQATSYYGVTHPSEPNYLAMISGSNWWINADSTTTRLDHVNLVDELEAAHKTWAAYMEAMPADDKLVSQWPTTTALYAIKHNPFVLFNDIRTDPVRMADVKPYTDLATDLQKERTTPDFAYIVPDQCNDMHGGVSAVAGHPETPCPYSVTLGDDNDKALKQKADAFVKTTVQEIMASQSWKGGKSAIFVVADEGDYTGNADNAGWDSPLGCCDSPVLPAGSVSSTWPGGVYGGGLVPAVVVVNHGGKTGGYASSTPYNHYSLLATIEDVWGLPLLGYASDTAQVTPMTEFLTP